ncbi:MAG: hypothetical protein ACFFDT_40200, partial [Candidatus Hodarchaeota archaeon]
MNSKPSDLMLNVIEFFGVLIPGAVLFFLHGDWFLRWLGFPMGELCTTTTKYWVIVFFISIILGHLLLGASDLFDKPAAMLFKKKTKWYLYLEAAKSNHLKLPPGVRETPKNYFYCAFSFLRVHNAVAVAELERLAAEKKLFRSLTLLFLLDIPLYIFSLEFCPASLLDLNRIILAILIVCLAALRFLQLFDFTYAVAFDLYLQVREAETAEGKSLTA